MDELWNNRVIAELRALGVKRAVIDGSNRVTEVEFFEPLPDLSALAEPGDEKSEAGDRPAAPPPALARLMAKGSVS